MDIKSVSSSNFGIMPPAYIQPPIEAVPAIVENIPAVKTVTITEKYYIMPPYSDTKTPPKRKPESQDVFIVREAIVADSKIRIPYSDKRSKKIHTRNLKTSGRNNTDKRITWV